MFFCSEIVSLNIQFPINSIGDLVETKIIDQLPTRRIHENFNMWKLCFIPWFFSWFSYFFHVAQKKHEEKVSISTHVDSSLKYFLFNKGFSDVYPTLYEISILNFLWFRLQCDTVDVDDLKSLKTNFECINNSLFHISCDMKEWEIACLL